MNRLTVVEEHIKCIEHWIATHYEGAPHSEMIPAVEQLLQLLDEHQLLVNVGRPERCLGCSEDSID